MGGLGAKGVWVGGPRGRMEGRGLWVTPLAAIHWSYIVETRGDIGARGATGFLLDCQRSLVEGLGLFVTTLVRIQHSEIVNTQGDIDVIGTCDGQSQAWVLRPSTGAICRFDMWAEEETATAGPIRMVIEAVDLVLMRSLGCTDVQARTADGDSIPLTTGY